METTSHDDLFDAFRISTVLSLGRGSSSSSSSRQ